ncbi:MAG: hypothetical protein QOI16_3893, partial [Pseudonocardiales bacterium]|nr:hypothetical protein [Pseudonocardiales bacterium]
TLPLVFGGGERERLRTRTWAQYNIPKSEARKFIEEGYGESGSRRLTPLACHRSVL